jgi:hypothetical protein
MVYCFGALVLSDPSVQEKNVRVSRLSEITISFFILYYLFRFKPNIQSSNVPLVLDIGCQMFVGEDHEIDCFGSVRKRVVVCSLMNRKNKPIQLILIQTLEIAKKMPIFVWFI